MIDEEERQRQQQEQQQQQQKEVDDIIDYSILDHQGELLDERYFPIIRSAMRRIPLDVVHTIASDINLRFLTITDQFYAVNTTLTDPYSNSPPEKRASFPYLNWELVIINDMKMKKLNPEDKQAVIAHELAHVYLKHGSDPLNEKDRDFEQEADDLIRTWGFNPDIKPLKHTRMAYRQSHSLV